MTYCELEAQFDALMAEADRKADDAISNPQNLTVNKVFKMANHGLEGLQLNDQAKLETPESSQQLNHDKEEDLNEIDREMIEDQ